MRAMTDTEVDAISMSTRGSCERGSIHQAVRTAQLQNQCTAFEAKWTAETENVRNPRFTQLRACLDLVGRVARHFSVGSESPQKEELPPEIALSSVFVV